MIPVEHANELRERCFGPCTFLSPETMTHNRFDVYEDVIKPLTNFLVNDVYSHSDDEDSEDEDVDNYGTANSLSNQFLASVHKVSIPKSSRHSQQPKGPNFREQFFIPP